MQISVCVCDIPKFPKTTVPHLALLQQAPQFRLRGLAPLRRLRVQPQPLARQADGAPLVRLHRTCWGMPAITQFYGYKDLYR